MAGLMNTSGLWMLRVALLLGLMLFSTGSTSPVPVHSFPFTAKPVSTPALSPGAWFEIEAAARREVNGSPFGFTTLQKPGGWEQHFEKVTDALELRVGSIRGPLISWPNSGAKGRFTWHKRDGVGTHSIRRWVGDSEQIKLWARVWSESNERPYCAMDTLYNGDRRQHWEFEGVAEYSIIQR
jgi:hypothetical protein